MEASLEILTDGSDFTGGPGIFLTLRKSKLKDKPSDENSSAITDNVFRYEIPATSHEEGSIVARYSLTGLPSLAGRLASDQSFKLLSDGAFRCVLLPSLTPGSTGGLAALFLSLVRAGYAVARPRCHPTANGVSDRDGSDSDSTLDDNAACSGTRQCATRSAYGDISIVGPQNSSTLIDGVLDTLFGNGRNRPAIRLCEVPTPSKDDQSECCWWDVYQDLYIRVWGRSVLKSCHAFCNMCNVNGGAQKKRRRAAEQSTDDCFSQASSSYFRASPITGRDDSMPTCHFVIYIVMVKPSPQNSVKGGHTSASSSIAFAILPHFDTNERSPKCHTCGKNIDWNNTQQSSLVWDTLRTLPQEVIDNATMKKGRVSQNFLDFILHLNPLSWEIESLDMAVNNLTETIPKSKDGSECLRPETSRNTSLEVPQRIIQVPTSSVENELTSHHLATFPDVLKGTFDPGLLIRAQHRSFLLNKHLPFAFYLGGRSRGIVTPDKLSPGGGDDSMRNVGAFQLRSCTSVRLNKASFHLSLDADIAPRNNQNRCRPFAFVSRIENICDRCGDHGESDRFILNPQIVSSLKRAYAGTGTRNDEAKGKADDDNEIDLDSSSVSVDDADDIEREHPEETFASDTMYPDVMSPHLLLLGTGCATPSPLRGSSSYALFMPTSESYSPDSNISDNLVLTAIIECGEGTLTSLSRYLLVRKNVSHQTFCLDEQLRWVQFIWISHSHLDHYGDLPSVVKAIADAKKDDTLHSRPLIVIAPSKVLKFLRVMLGAHARSKYAAYVGITHREFQSSPFATSVRSMLFECTLPIPSRCKYEYVNNDAEDCISKSGGLYCPFVSLRNIEVDHCQDAFALLLELRLPWKANSQQFLLCFSGDTRPSDNLVRECRSYNRVSQSVTTHVQQAPIHLSPPPRISLLLHESTFLNDNLGKIDAIKKRHSTVSEALYVAERIQAEACLLTHFSQRYSHVSIQDACNDIFPVGKPSDVSTSPDPTLNCHTFAFGFGVDGMVIPLSAIAFLYQLSQCIDILVSSHPD